MERKMILSNVIEVCNDVFDDESVAIGESTLLVDDLGCDSIKKLIFINMLSSKFGITLKLDDSLKMNTISDVCDIVEKYL